MPKIALIRSSETNAGYDSWETVIHSITDWYDATDEEYQLLYNARWSHGYHILTFMPHNTIAQTVAEQLEAIRVEQERKEAEKARRAEAQKLTQIEKTKRDAEKKLKQIQKLQKELADAGIIEDKKHGYGDR